MNLEENVGHRRLTRKRLILSSLLTLLVCFLILELLVRLFYATVADPSDALFYGFRGKTQHTVDAQDGHTVAYHSNEMKGYTKYYPHEKKVDHDPVSGERFQVTINSKGFRGNEFREEKENGVTRVVTLGASSTFGYYNRDSDAYPYRMEQILNEQCGRDRSFEVINLGIPHSTSDQLVALFLAEALPLSPDVVTYYQGMADTKRQLGRKTERMPIFAKVFNALRARSICVSFTDSFLKSQAAKYTEEYLREHLVGRSDRYFGNVLRIHEECRKRGILFVMASQQGRSDTWIGDELKGITYEDEKQRLEKMLTDEGHIDRNQLAFLTHADLMANVESFTTAHEVPFVDIIEALDQRRDVLYSWVHVSPEGNQMIAREFAREILKHVCPQTSTGYDAAGQP